MSEAMGDGEDRDDTRLSPRTWADAAEDATRVTGRRQAGDRPVDPAGERTGDPQDGEDDPTVLARRSEGDPASQPSARSVASAATVWDPAAGPGVQAARGPVPLPPGRTEGPETRRGTFGVREPGYHPRAVPAPGSAPAAGSPPESGDASATPRQHVLTPQEAARRRDAARRRRVVAIVAVGAASLAVLSAAVAGAVLLLVAGP